MFDVESQADNAGRAKGEKKREKTSCSSKENFEQNNNNGTKREKKRVSSPTIAEESLLQLLRKATNKGRLNNATIKSSLLSRRCSRAVLFLVARGTIKLEQKSLL